MLTVSVLTATLAFATALNPYGIPWERRSRQNKRQDTQLTLDDYILQVDTARFALEFILSGQGPGNCDPSNRIEVYDEQGYDGGYAQQLLCASAAGIDLFPDVGEALEGVNAALAGLRAQGNPPTGPSTDVNCEAFDVSVLYQVGLDGDAIRSLICDSLEPTSTVAVSSSTVSSEFSSSSSVGPTTTASSTIVSPSLDSSTIRTTILLPETASSSLATSRSNAAAASTKTFSLSTSSTRQAQISSSSVSAGLESSSVFDNPMSRPLSPLMMSSIIVSSPSLAPSSLSMNNTTALTSTTLAADTLSGAGTATFLPNPINTTASSTSSTTNAATELASSVNTISSTDASTTSGGPTTSSLPAATASNEDETASSTTGLSTLPASALVLDSTSSIPLTSNTSAFTNGLTTTPSCSPALETRNGTVFFQPTPTVVATTTVSICDC